MKKILVLIVLLFLLSSQKCEYDNNEGQNYVIEKTFSIDEELISLRALENIMIEMEIDPIPHFSSWLTFSVSRYDGYIVQRLHVLKTDTVVYDIIYNTIYMKDPDSTFYEVKVRKIEPHKKIKN